MGLSTSLDTNPVLSIFIISLQYYWLEINFSRLYLTGTRHLQVATMSSTDAASQIGEGNAARRMVNDATYIDEAGSRRMKPKEWMDCVVVPLPEICKNKENEYSTSGKEIDVTVNGYPVQKFPKKPVYMYEVSKALAISCPSKILS